MNLEMEILDREYLAERRGRAEGRVEERAEGQNEARKSIAFDMIRMGKSVDEIQMLTKLPVDRIIELADRLKK